MSTFVFTFSSSGEPVRPRTPRRSRIKWSRCHLEEFWGVFSAAFRADAPHCRFLLHRFYLLLLARSFLSALFVFGTCHMDSSVSRTSKNLHPTISSVPPPHLNSSPPSVTGCIVASKCEPVLYWFKVLYEPLMGGCCHTW